MTSRPFDSDHHLEKQQYDNSYSLGSLPNGTKAGGEEGGKGDRSSSPFDQTSSPTGLVTAGGRRLPSSDRMRKGTMYAASSEHGRFGNGSGDRRGTTASTPLAAVDEAPPQHALVNYSSSDSNHSLTTETRQKDQHTRSLRPREGAYSSNLGVAMGDRPTLLHKFDPKRSFAGKFVAEDLLDGYFEPSSEPRIESRNPHTNHTPSSDEMGKASFVANATFGAADSPADRYKAKARPAMHEPRRAAPNTADSFYGIPTSVSQPDSFYGLPTSVSSGSGSQPHSGTASYSAHSGHHHLNGTATTSVTDYSSRSNPFTSAAESSSRSFPLPSTAPRSSESNQPARLLTFLEACQARGLTALVPSGDAEGSAEDPDISAHLQSIIIHDERQYYSGNPQNSSLRAQPASPDRSDATSFSNSRDLAVGPAESESAAAPRCSTPVSFSYNDVNKSSSSAEFIIASGFPLGGAFSAATSPAKDAKLLPPHLRPNMARGSSAPDVPAPKSEAAITRPSPGSRSISWGSPSALNGAVTPRPNLSLPAIPIPSSKASSSAPSPTGLVSCTDEQEAFDQLPALSPSALSPPALSPSSLSPSSHKGQFEHHRSPPSPPPLDPMSNIYISNLPEEATDENLYQLAISLGGTVASHKAIIDPDTGACKGYGFIMYSSPEETDRALGRLAEMGFQASRARESFTAKLRRCADKDSNNLYLHGIPRSYTYADIHHLVHPSQIVSTRILKDSEGGSRGIALVRLETHEIAQETTQRLNGTMFPSGEKLVVRFADSEAQRELKRNVIPLGLGRQQVNVTHVRSFTPSISPSPSLYDVMQAPFSAPPSISSFSSNNFVPDGYPIFPNYTDHASAGWPGRSAASSPTTGFFPRTPGSFPSSASYSSRISQSSSEQFPGSHTQDTTVPSLSRLGRSQSVREHGSEHEERPQLHKASTHPQGVGLDLLPPFRPPQQAFHANANMMQRPPVEYSHAPTAVREMPAARASQQQQVPKLSISMPSSDDALGARASRISPRAQATDQRALFNLPSSEGDDVHAISRSSPPISPVYEDRRRSSRRRGRGGGSGAKVTNVRINPRT